MTLGDQVTYVHRLAAATAGQMNVSVDSEATRKYINEGVREFLKGAGGVPKEDYLTVTPRFDTRTNWAIRLTITGGSNALAATDIAVTSTDRSNVAGSQVATDLQTAIQAAGAGSATVAFNTSGADIWKFTIDSSDGTSIQVEAPSRVDYVDATDLLFGKTDTQTSTTWVSSFPQDFLVETDLPSNFLTLTHVEWDGHPLVPAPFEFFISPSRHGTPQWYAVKNKKIRVYPAPTDQELFHIWYRGVEDDLAVDSSADSTTSPLPAQVHMAPVYYAASKILEETHEYDKADRLFRDYLNMVGEYSRRENNANPSLFPNAEPVVIPRVESESTT